MKIAEKDKNHESINVNLNGLPKGSKDTIFSVIELLKNYADRPSVLHAILGAINLCLVEIYSIRQKVVRDEKTREEKGRDDIS